MLCWQDQRFVNGSDEEELTLEELRINRWAALYTVAAGFRQIVVQGIHPAEMASWPLKLREAQSVDGSATPMLDAEARARGISTSDLRIKILANAELFSRMEAQISGNSGRHADVIRDLATVEELRTYDFRDGWPFEV